MQRPWGRAGPGALAEQRGSSVAGAGRTRREERRGGQRSERGGKVVGSVPVGSGASGLT